MRWVPVAVSAAIATVVVAARHGADAAFPLQVVAIALASGAGFAFDDEAAELLAPSPTRLIARRLRRLLLIGPPVVILWSLLLGWQGTAGPHETQVVWSLFAGLLGLALAIAGIATRRAPRSGGLAVAPGLFVLLIASTVAPPRFRPLPMGDIPGGLAQISLRWATAAVLGTLVFLYSSRDPARSR